MALRLISQSHFSLYPRENKVISYSKGMHYPYQIGIVESKNFFIVSGGIVQIGNLLRSHTTGNQILLINPIPFQVLKFYFENCKYMYKTYADIAETYQKISKGDYISNLIAEEKKREEEQKNLKKKPIFHHKHSRLMQFDKPEFYNTISIVPAPIRIQPMIDLAVNFSCRKTNANTKVNTTLSLSMGITLETSPTCSAL